MAVGAGGHGRQADRRGRGRRPDLGADGGGHGNPARACRAFVAEKFPAPAGPDPASIGGEAEYGAARDTLSEAYGRETAAAHSGWSAGVRDRARAAGTPRPGGVAEDAIREGARTETDMIVRASAREARTAVTRDDALEGRAGVAAETEKPFEHHATENLPLIGGWLAGKLFGTARNAAPDGEPPKTMPAPDWGNQSP